MIITAQSGLRGVLVNAETGERIPFAYWANTETGEWRGFAATPDHKFMIEPPRRVKGKCALRFIQSGVFLPSGQKPLSFEENLKEIRKIAPDYVKTTNIRGHGFGCDAPACLRKAEYQTADEQEIDPTPNGDGMLARRAVTVATHNWCSWHYRNPLKTNLRGVTEEKETLVRPQ